MRSQELEVRSQKSDGDRVSCGSCNSRRQIRPMSLAQCSVLPALFDDRKMRSDFGHASAGCVRWGWHGPIRDHRRYPRLVHNPASLGFGLDSRVRTSERRWIVTSISKHVLNGGNRVVKCQLSCQNGRRPMKTNPDNRYFAPQVLSDSCLVPEPFSTCNTPCFPRRFCGNGRQKMMITFDYIGSCHFGRRDAGKGSPMKYAARHPWPLPSTRLPPTLCTTRGEPASPFAPLPEGDGRRQPLGGLARDAWRQPA